MFYLFYCIHAKLKKIALIMKKSGTIEVLVSARMGTLPISNPKFLHLLQSDKLT